MSPTWNARCQQSGSQSAAEPNQPLPQGLDFGFSAGRGSKPEITAPRAWLQTPAQPDTKVVGSAPALDGSARLAAQHRPRADSPDTGKGRNWRGLPSFRSSAASGLSWPGPAPDGPAALSQGPHSRRPRAQPRGLDVLALALSQSC